MVERHPLSRRIIAGLFASSLVLGYAALADDGSGADESIDELPVEIAEDGLG